MANRGGYSTVYWGKMPVNFRPQAFPKHEVEAAVNYAERSFLGFSDLVPDFSVLTLGREPEGGVEAVLVLGDEGSARVFRRGGREGEDWILGGLMWEIALRVRSRRRREHARAVEPEGSFSELRP